MVMMYEPRLALTQLWLLSTALAPEFVCQKHASAHNHHYLWFNIHVYLTYLLHNKMSVQSACYTVTMSLDAIRDTIASAAEQDASSTSESLYSF